MKGHWKVYNATHGHEADVKHGELAAAVVSVLGDGATVRTAGGQVVWREGAEEFPAGDSYDNANAVFIDRATTGDVAPFPRTGPPEDGVDRCYCGAKYWDGNACHSCGEEFKR
jgi:hypothetical protein